MPLGLSKEALELRRSHVMAGDMGELMKGNWKKVYREKMGAASDDLSRVLAVAMGSYTEPFNLFWYMQETGRAVTYCTENPLMRAIWKDLTGLDAEPETHVSHDYPFMGCNLDARSVNAAGRENCLDAKCVGKSGDDLVKRYTPAMTHQCIVTGLDHWALSVFVRNSRWELIEQEVDPLYAGEVIATAEEFWGYVERGEEPADRIPEATPPQPAPRLRVVQLDDQFEADWPNWSREMITYLHDFRSTKAAADAHAISRKQIIELLPEDVGLVERENIRVKRDLRGITVSLKKKEKS